MKAVPTTWDETVLIDGYPGKYVVLARRHADRWYIAGINAEKEEKELTIHLPMLAGEKWQLYVDNKDRTAQYQEIPARKDKLVKVTLQADGGFLIVGQ
ncbi:glycoside hydrolase family 97 C-terminal domain-containing protein [Sphingobacterium faecium]|nr:glycoside hydrolase family 97 C-terminal domain-containing protein [Sphingobacterium faecium]MDH5826960.1 glycoside hydrolase family 97 C-terminal domain-containing protein [Sphingobacterium faecium]